jgi:hypothetical protein
LSEGDGIELPRLSLEQVRELGLGLSWTDNDGVTHGCDAGSTPEGEALVWTWCHRGVPANGSEAPPEPVDCPVCLLSRPDGRTLVLDPHLPLSS